MVIWSNVREGYEDIMLKKRQGWNTVPFRAIKQQLNIARTSSERLIRCPRASEEVIPCRSMLTVTFNDRVLSVPQHGFYPTPSLFLSNATPDFGLASAVLAQPMTNLLPLPRWKAMHLYGIIRKCTNAWSFTIALSLPSSPFAGH